MIDHSPVCGRCGSTHALRFFVVYHHYDKTAQGWICKACYHEFDRFLAGDATPGTHTTDDSKRGFEIERGTDGKDRDAGPSPDSPEASARGAGSGPVDG